MWLLELVLRVEGGGVIGTGRGLDVVVVVDEGVVEVVRWRLVEMEGGVRLGICGRQGGVLVVVGDGRVGEVGLVVLVVEGVGLEGVVSILDVVGLVEVVVVVVVVVAAVVLVALVVERVVGVRRRVREGIGDVEWSQSGSCRGSRHLEMCAFALQSSGLLLAERKGSR